MPDHPIVSDQQWLAARQELLQKEKEFSRQRDELTELRRKLPWRKVEKSYEFDGEGGKVTLSDLFAGRSQLLIYHFMFDPDWDQGCKVCSMIGDHYDPILVHLRQRDVELVTVSRAPWDKLSEFKQHKGWTFPWVSSFESDFNQDFHVTFTQEERESGKAFYNYQYSAEFPVNEYPGISAFIRDESGTLFHSYSSYARGLEEFLGIYRFLDIVPKGRDERALPYPMAWVQHKDQYGNPYVVDPYL